jgi:lantibiotic modifying enzyme
MPAESGAPAARWLAIAGEIADRLCQEAYRYDGQCTWMGTVQHGGLAHDAATFTWETLGPDLYGGSSGVALFLAEMYGRTGEARYREIAREALRFSAGRLDRIPARFRQGFYSGRVGVAFAFARGGELLADPGLAQQAARELDHRIADENEAVLLDIISGAAGSVAPLLSLARSLGRGDLLALAERLGGLIVAAAEKDSSGWKWGDDATGFQSFRPLTGYGHGAAGMGTALLELFAATGDPVFREAGRQAFRYENTLFDPERDNWPDFRYSAETGERGHYGVAWCLGAPGVGLSRLRAVQIDAGTPQHRLDAEAALRTVRRRLEGSADAGVEDFSLCHGWAGLGDFALLAATALGSDEARSLAEEIGDRGAAANAGTPGRWHSGLQRGTHPSLMLGLAGIGHFYLRLADASVASLTLLTATAAPGFSAPA